MPFLGTQKHTYSQERKHNIGAEWLRNQEERFPEMKW